jgi:hypothetical protein
MSSIVLSGDTSGSVTVSVPAVAGTNTVTIPATTGTVMVSSNMPAFSAYASAATQSLGNGVYTKIAINTKEFDTANCFDATTNYRFTPTVAGYYQVNGQVNIVGTTSTRNLVTIYKNGAEYKRGTDLGGLLATTLNATVSSIIYLNGSTDYVELYAYVAATGSTVNGGVTYQTYFNGCLVRAA